MHDLDAAKLIQKVPDASSAKQLGDKIKHNELWTDSNEASMTELIENKWCSCKCLRESLDRFNRRLFLQNRPTMTHEAQDWTNKALKTPRWKPGPKRTTWTDYW